MNKSRKNFSIFLLAGLLTTCVLGGVATWLSLGEALERLQKHSLEASSHEISVTIDSRIGDFVNGLEFLARRPRLISTVMGDETQIENVRDVVRTFDLYDDLVSLQLVDVLGETILSEVIPSRGNTAFTAEPPAVQPLIDKVLAEDGKATARLHYVKQRGKDYLFVAVPILRNGGTEGVLLGAFRLDLASFVGIDTQLTSLMVEAPALSEETVGRKRLQMMSTLPKFGLTLRFLWSLDRVREERRKVALTVTGSLLVGLLLAYGGLAWVGQRIILGPQRELEASRTALAESESKARELAAIVENTLDPTVVNDKEGRMVWANHAMFEKFGYSHEEMLGQRIVELLSGPDTQTEEVCAAYNAKQPYLGELVNYKRDGTRVDVLLSLQPVLDTEGQLQRYVGIGRDITELKSREAELEEARARADAARAETTESHLRLEEAIEALDDGFVFFDKNDVLITFNHAYKQLLGDGGAFLARDRSYREQAMELAVSGVVPGIKGGEEAFVDKLVAERSTTNGVDKVFLSDKGRWIHQRDKRTASGSYVGLRIDITELKEREKELERERQRAEAANYAKSNFLANMSHEIRTPMNGIIGMCELLNETDMNDEQRLCARTITSSAEALLTIINNILDFSKIEAGKQEILNEPFSLHSVVFDVARLLHAAAHEKTLEICVDYDDALCDHYTGDIGRVRQVLINLVGNAVKFTDQGYVLLALKPSKCQPGAIAFKVADTGMGIPKQKLERVFQAFEQVDNESTRQHDGTGLGLAITDGLVEAMGGEITVQSRVGLGSRFLFDLPLTPAPEPPTTTRPDASVLIAECEQLLQGKTVLVVDDLEVNRYILCKRLARLGATTISLTSPEEVLDLVLDNAANQAPKIDVAIFDHQMPGMDGEKLLLTLSGRKAQPPFPTVLYSSMDFSVDSRRLRSLGFAAVIVKPASRKALCRALLTALRGDTTDTNLTPQTPDVALPTGLLDVDSGQQLRVMAAEDNRTNQLVLKKMLAAFPVSLEIFSNGEEILEAYIDRGADLIFMDVSMPVMGGLEATAAIRKHETESRSPRCPIVALTAKAMKHHQQECMHAGMDDFLTKPIKKIALAEALSKHIVQLDEDPTRKSA
ncbi:MAG: response regulator [Paracoccaceae bacterium]